MKQSSHFLILRDLPPLLSSSIYRIHTLSLARSTKILKASLSCLLVFQHCPSQWILGILGIPGNSGNSGDPGNPRDSGNSGNPVLPRDSHLRSSGPKEVHGEKRSLGDSASEPGQGEGESHIFIPLILNCNLVVPPTMRQ